MQRGLSLDKNQRKSYDRFVSSKKLNSQGYQLKKEVVVYVLNKTLLGSGMEVYDMVNRSLYEKYRCDISDCFEKPEYLADVLRFVFDGSYHIVAESLAKNLERFTEEAGIKEFLEILGQE